jgi:hypothetical protein
LRFWSGSHRKEERAMSRQMTPEEKQQFQAWFPALDVNRAIVTDEATKAYNCIAWTVGVTNAWLWPGGTIQDFDAFYARRGYGRTSSGHIAAWGVSLAEMKHGSTTAPPPLVLWESKCGSSLRIQHGMNELESPSYGRILAYYGRSRLLRSAEEREIEAANGDRLSVELHAQERDRLEQEAGKVDPELKDRFESLFESWKREWDTPYVALSSDPGIRRHTASFGSLVSLGPGILPLVAKALADPSNFFALQLYDALEAREHMRVTIEPDSDAAIEGEQGRALRTVRRYLSAQ